MTMTQLSGHLTPKQHHEVRAFSDADPEVGALPLGAFLTRTGAVLRAGWPEALLVEATVVKVSTNAGGHTLELIDPGPRGAAAGQLRAFLPTAALPDIRRDLGVAFDPNQLVGLDAVLRLAPGFDPKWHLQARVLGLGRSMQASLAARLIEEVRDRLRREGLLDRQRRLPCPADVTRLAVVHPAGGAGLADVERELRAWMAAGLLQVRFLAAPFEGPGAAARLAASLRQAAEPIAGQPPDLVLLVRGGGARSGLLQLDDEALARAVATLPMPVVTGLGHASDTGLLDAVAHVAADTPSKALAIVGELIREPGRRALADHADIGRAAVTRLDAVTGDLATLRLHILGGAERVLANTSADTAARWAAVEAGAVAGRASVDGANAALDRCLAQAIAAVPVAVTQATIEGERLIRRISEAARAHIARVPDADGVMAAARTQATRILVAAARDADRLIDVIAGAAARLIDQHEALLRQAERGLADLDHTAVLGRGYALARDADGRVLTSRAAAEAARHFTIEFGDGVLAVVTVDPQPASPKA